MHAQASALRRVNAYLFILALPVLPLTHAAAQQMATETRDLKQLQDAGLAKLYAQWTGDAKYGSPLVDHLPIVKGFPTPRNVPGYYVGAPKRLTCYADMLKYYRALAAATPRVPAETIGRSDEGRELVVVLEKSMGAGWVVLDVLFGVVPVVIDAVTGDWSKVGGSCTLVLDKTTP